MSERTWLHHPATGGHFHCPNEALEAWTAQGWEPTDEPPAAPNPVVAERIAWEAEQAALRAAEETAVAEQPDAEHDSAATEPEGDQHAAPAEAAQPIAATPAAESKSKSARRGNSEES